MTVLHNKSKERACKFKYFKNLKQSNWDLKNKSKHLHTLKWNNIHECITAMKQYTVWTTDMIQQCGRTMSDRYKGIREVTEIRNYLS